MIRGLARLTLALGILSIFAILPGFAQNANPPSTAPPPSNTAPAQHAPQSAPLPNAPSPASSSTEPSLSDLGFTAQQTQADPKLQATLEKRTEMLKIHQKLGLITAAPMLAALISEPLMKTSIRMTMISATSAAPMSDRIDWIIADVMPPVVRESALNCDRKATESRALIMPPIAA